MIVHDCDRGARYGLVGNRDWGAGSGGGARGSCVFNGDVLSLWGCDWGCRSRAEGGICNTDIPTFVDEMPDQQGMLFELPELGEREV